MADGMEIERRFLLRPLAVKELLKGCCPDGERWRIAQYYLPPKGPGERVRYRKVGSRCIKTIKSGQGLVRQEREGEVPCKEFRRMRSRRMGRVIVKDRFRFPYAGHLFELDRFRGWLKGLVILEVEFPSAEAAEAFRLPEPFASLLVGEVTEDFRFTNASLCCSPFPPAWEGECPGDRLCPWRETGTMLQTVLSRQARLLAKRGEALRRGEDPEALHDFRVAVRRLRVWLGECRDLWCDAWESEMRAYLKGLISRTNAARDREVLLETLKAMEPELRRKDRKVLRKIRKRIAEEVSPIPDLGEGEEEESLVRIVEVLEEGGKKAMCPLGRAPAEWLLRRRIRRSLKRIERWRARWESTRDEEAMHRLRIALKKLRYCLEESRELADPQRSAEAVAMLKSLQDLLGEYHDFSVERAFLKVWAKEEGSKEERRIVRRVRRRMEKRMKALRPRIDKRLKKFEKKRKLYTKYFERLPVQGKEAKR